VKEDFPANLESSVRYIDFLAGSGSLNYGHNPPRLKEAIIGYLRHDGVVTSLDLHTEAKARFVRRFNEVILQPRGIVLKFLLPLNTPISIVQEAMSSLAGAFRGAFESSPSRSAYAAVRS
jgi:hypothetical protein